MMNNFTPRAQQVLALARKEADRFNHNYVGTEHLLLGLIKLGQGVAVNVLQKMGLDLETVRMADLAQLLRYCHRAAGTVGLHMSCLLRAADPNLRQCERSCSPTAGHCGAEVA